MTVGLIFMTHGLAALLRSCPWDADDAAGDKQTFRLPQRKENKQVSEWPVVREGPRLLPRTDAHHAFSCNKSNLAELRPNLLQS